MAAMPKRSRPDDSQAFSFGFTVSEAEPTEGAAVDTAAEESPCAPQSGSYARVTRDVGGTGWGSSSGEASCAVSRGTVVRLHWTHPDSTGHHVWVTQGDGGKGGCVPVAALQLLPSELDKVHRSPPAGPVDHPSLHVIDTLFAPEHKGLPLVLEPGLDSLVWPLTPEAFVTKYYRRRALAIHASASRLSSLSSDLQHLSIPAMIASSSRLVVWMRELGKGGKMQYLDSPPAVGEACYKAGHSLYFNPPADTQARWMRPLCQDLGLHTGLEAGSIGGDIEIFAVQGKHRTPWHWDGQENITLQLQGTKRWRVRPSGVPDPATNLHPGAAGEAPREDWKMHAACAPQLAGDGSLLPPHLAPGADPGHEGVLDPSIATVVLRPGSMLYVPSGWWHAVDAEDEEEGSLSLNFSCVGSRWVELLTRRLVPYLLSVDSRWRGRLPTGPGLGQGQLQSMMADLPGHIGRLVAGDLLPPVSSSGRAHDELLLLPVGWEDSSVLQAPASEVGLGGGEHGHGHGPAGTGRGKRRRRQEESEDDDEGVDDDSSTEIGRTWQRSADRCLDLLSSLPAWPQADGVTVQRRPCVTLCIEGAHRGRVDTAELSLSHDERGSRTYPTVSATLHAGYGTGGVEPQASDRTLTLHAGRDMLPLLHKLAGMEYFATVSATELYAMHAQDERERVQSLLRILLHAGYLALA